MTIDRSDDDLISIDGVDKYAFTETDAGDLPHSFVRDGEADDEEVSVKETDERGQEEKEEQVQGKEEQESPGVSRRL